MVSFLGEFQSMHMRWQCGTWQWSLRVDTGLSQGPEWCLSTLISNCGQFRFYESPKCQNNFQCNVNIALCISAHCGHTLHVFISSRSPNGWALARPSYLFASGFESKRDYLSFMIINWMYATWFCHINHERELRVKGFERDFLCHPCVDSWIR